LRLSGRRDLADDLFQETFIQLARHAQTLAADTNLAAFLYTVARNRYRNQRRMALFRLDRLRALFASSGPGTAPAATPTPLEQVAASDTARQLEQALAALRPPLREVLLLVGVEGMDAAAAAAVLDISEAALRQRLSRARAQLAALLQSTGNGDDHGA
jgi:RNA polymerase sigma-70 factor (ECF subfamily)